MARYVALLRGINVGGKHIIKMAALKTCFEEHGFGDVATFIQSGNVLFDGAGAGAALTRRVEAMLAAAFAYRATVVLRTHAQLRRVVGSAPPGFGGDPARYRYDAMFLMPPLTAAAAIAHVPTKDGVDQVFPGPGVLYTTRLISRASESRLARITGAPIYPQLTVRNWATTTKLLALMDGQGARR